MSVLQKPQQMALQIDRHIADLVEEQRTPPACSISTPGARGGPGEGALLIAEQFRGDQGGRKGGAVDGDERTGAASRPCVQRAGSQLLSGAALAGDQHRVVGAGEALHHLQDLTHRRAVADEFRLAIGAVGRGGFGLCVRGRLLRNGRMQSGE